MVRLSELECPAYLVYLDEDNEFVFTDVNVAAVRMSTGQSAEHRGPVALRDAFPPDVAAMVAGHFATCMRQRRSVEFDSSVPLAIGQIVTRTTLHPLSDGMDRPVRRLLGTVVDITAEHRIRDELVRSNARLTAAMKALGGCHWYFDALRKRFDLSAGFAEILEEGYAPSIALDDWLGHVHPEDQADTCFNDILAGHIDSGTSEFRIRRRGGDVCWLRCQREAVKDGPIVVGIAGVVIDVTREKAREALLTIEATTDPLTGVGNRRSFDRALASAQALDADISLLMIDVDHFKAFNDAYGHPAGDVALREIARLLADAAEPVGGRIFRYGGEEFAVLIYNHATEAAIAVAQDVLMHLLAKAIPHCGARSGRLSVSIGVVSVPRFGRGRQTILQQADAALYQAKRNGRCRVSVARYQSKPQAFLQGVA